jgi:hypothetical protein
MRHAVSKPMDGFETVLRLVRGWRLVREMFFLDLFVFWYITELAVL